MNGSNPTCIVIDDPWFEDVGRDLRAAGHWLELYYLERRACAAIDAVNAKADQALRDVKQQIRARALIEHWRIRHHAISEFWASVAVDSVPHTTLSRWDSVTRKLDGFTYLGRYGRVLKWPEL